MPLLVTDVTWCRGGAGSLALAAVEDGATLRHLLGLGRLALLSHTRQRNHKANEDGYMAGEPQMGVATK